MAKPLTDKQKIKRLKDLVVELAEALRGLVHSEFSVDIRDHEDESGEAELYHRAYRLIGRQLPK